MKGNYNEIREGDALQQLKEIDDDSIDLLCTDPPYGYSFMNKDWDKAVVSVDVWHECLRVLKAGAFAFVMSAPRQDVLSRMIVNLQDAGFRTDFTSIYYSYASGFPKAANTFKMLEKREKPKDELKGSYLGFQPKPAVEVILTVMKPLSEKSFVDQALNNGKGITWLDDCRIPFQNEHDKEVLRRNCEDHTSKQQMFFNTLKNPEFAIPNNKGRFPANLLVSDDALNDGKIRVSKYGKQKQYSSNSESHMTFCNKKDKTIEGVNNFVGDSGSYSRYFDLDSWYSKQIEAQFIITPKAAPSERNGSTHPTMKPIKLMSYLITLGSRENDIVLDPFCGSGTTLIAAEQLHRRWIGIELNTEYAEIARKRIEPYLVQQKLL